MYQQPPHVWAGVLVSMSWCRPLVTDTLLTRAQHFTRPLTDMSRPMEDRKIKMTDFPPHFYSMTVIHQLGNNNLHFDIKENVQKWKIFWFRKTF